MGRRSKVMAEKGMCAKGLHPWVEGQVTCQACLSKRIGQEQPAPAASVRTTTRKCGYCLTGDHDLCSSGHTWGVTGITYICPCSCEKGKPDA